MNANLEAALLAVDNALTVAQQGASITDAQDRPSHETLAMAQSVSTTYDSIGHDATLAAELEALSIYENHLTQQQQQHANGDGDGDDDEQPVDPARLNEQAAKATLEPSALTGTTRPGDTLAPLLPTPSAQSALRMQKAAKNRKRREQRRWQEIQRQHHPSTLQHQLARQAAGNDAPVTADSGLTAADAAADKPPNDKAAPHKRYVASAGFGDSVGPLEFMVDAKSGDVAMTRSPLSIEEWTTTLNAMANDLNTRFYCDPMWMENAMNMFQQLKELGTKVNMVAPGEDALIKLKALQAQAFIDAQRSFYEFVCRNHMPLLTTSFRLAKADMVLGITCNRLKPHKIMPVGCGDCHAVVLCNTERFPNRYHLLYALLTGDSIVTNDDVTRGAGILAGPERARSVCWPRYQQASGFRLTDRGANAEDDVEILHVSIHKQHVVVAFCPHGRTDLHVGIHSLSQPSQRTTVLRFEHIQALAEWRVASNGRFVAVAYNDGQVYRFPCAASAPTTEQPSSSPSPQDISPAKPEQKITTKERHPPNKLAIWLLGANAPCYCFPLSFEAAPSDGNDGCQLFDRDQPTVVTALCFDVNITKSPNLLCVATFDRRALCFELAEPRADELTSPGTVSAAYVQRAHQLVGTTFQQCYVTPSREQELRFAELNPRSAPSNSAREPPTWLHTEYGFHTRLSVLSPNNFLLKTLCGFGKQPTINEHLASYDGLQLGTLPLIYQHGAGHVQSIATAGNLMMVHFARENDIVLINMRDQTQLMALKGSAMLGYSVPESVSEAEFAPNADASSTEAEARRVEELRRAIDADPFKPQYYYQSTWATLARLAVLMTDGTLLLFEPKNAASRRDASAATPQQMAGEMFAARATSVGQSKLADEQTMQQ